MERHEFAHCFPADAWTGAGSHEPSKIVAPRPKEVSSEKTFSLAKAKFVRVTQPDGPTSYGKVG